MEQIISKEEIKKVMDIKGNVRGGAIKSKFSFILSEEGREGLEKLEKALQETGYPLKNEEIKNTEFYPLSFLALMLTLIKRLFGYNNEKFQEIGRFETRTSSLLVRIFAKYFFSPERVVKEIPGMWEKAFNTGKLKVIEYNPEKRHLIVRLEDFSFHPLHCEILKGYFSSVFKMVVGNDVACREEKCIFKGNDYHEFILSW